MPFTILPSQYKSCSFPTAKFKTPSRAGALASDLFGYHRFALCWPGPSVNNDSPHPACGSVGVVGAVDAT